MSSSRVPILIAVACLALVSAQGCKKSNKPQPSKRAHEAQKSAEQPEGAAAKEESSTGKESADVGACEPREVARQKVGSVDKVAPGYAGAEDSEEIHWATIDASTGGPAHMKGAPWLYVDLKGAKKVELTDKEAFESSAWDLAFKNTLIRVNGGDSGPAKWQVLAVDSPWDKLHDAPGDAEAWQTDNFVKADCTLETYGMGFPMTAFGRWYDYDPKTHTASAPENAVFALRNQETEQVWKFEILSYEDGKYRVRWVQF